MEGDTMNSPTPKLTPILIGIEVVAEVLGVSVAHVKRLRVSGRIPRPVRLGKRTLWRAAELDEWCRSGCPDRARWELEKGDHSG